MEMMGITTLLYKTIALFGVGELLCLTLKHKEKLKRKEGEKASAEIKDYREMGEYLGMDGLILTDNIRLKNKFDYENVCIVAPTGAGKTTKFFYPNLLDKNLKGSIVVIDPKGELYRDTSKFQEQVCKRKVIKFSPLENSAHKYNLLEESKTTTEVSQLASNLLLNGALSLELATGKNAGGIEWLQMSEPLLTAALLYCKSLKRPFNTIENALNLIINRSEADLYNLFTNSTEDVKNYYNIYSRVINSPNTAGSIKVTLTSNLKLFIDKTLNANLFKTTFNAELFRKEESILYITFPENKAAFLAPFIAPFLTQFIDSAINSYTENSKPIHFLFDEFANIGMINNFQGYVSTSRSRKLSFSICLQSLSQLQQIYGLHNYKTILNNLKSKIFLAGITDISTLEYVEVLTGKKVINTISKTLNKQNEASYSFNKEVKNVLNKDEVRRIKENECLIIFNNKQPILDTQTPYFLKDRYKECIKGEVKEIISNNNYNNYKEEFNKYIDKEIIRIKLELDHQEKELETDFLEKRLRENENKDQKR